RTSKTATVPISDELTRALENIIRFIDELRGDEKEIDRIISSYDSDRNRKELLKEISSYLESSC
ncbi:MAG: phosphopantothenate/pantothenate synthetase family protein, partial [Methanomassiliicoccales archaeon]|nr:phosphopantothenate/pantothenate synthetase family protein [Methanomassiliicoccales archaeon]